jgi:hypothetical protein
MHEVMMEKNKEILEKLKPEEQVPEDQLALLGNYNSVIEASIAMVKLADNGIESFVEEENVMGLNPLGGAELKVFLKDFEAARKIIENRED